MKIIRNIQYLLGLALLMSACSDYDWDFDHETTLSAFDLTTTEVTRVVTKETKQDVMTLAWNQSKAADNTVVFYTVMFSGSDKFDAPVYTTITDNVGIANSLAIKDTILNMIAEKAGIAQETTGNIYWKVQASNGINSQMSNNMGTIRITRPLGYAYNPDAISLMGEASAAGENADAAIPLRMVAGDKATSSTGIFEGLVGLKAGKKYYFVERLENNTFRRFAVSGDKLVEGDDVASVSLGEGVHHIKINFNDASVDVKLVTRADFVWEGVSDWQYTMMSWNDTSHSWSVVCNADEAYDVEWVNYKFLLNEQDTDGNVSEYWLGYTKLDGIENPLTAKNADDDFYLYELPAEADLYDYLTGYNLTTLLGKNPAGRSFKMELFTTPRLSHKVTAVE